MCSEVWTWLVEWDRHKQECEKCCGVCLGKEESTKETHIHGKFKRRLGEFDRKYQLAPFSYFLTYFHVTSGG